MKSRFKFLHPILGILIGTVCLAQSASQRGESSREVWQRLRRQYLSLRTLSGTFEQTVCSEVDGACRSFTGNFAFRLPAEFRLEVTDPVRQVIIGS
ncbi:MAG: outer-membrane lipoprotein carrier protein LolA, partial [candidate division WOR-3 bacterium]